MYKFLLIMVLAVITGCASSKGGSSCAISMVLFSGLGSGCDAQGAAFQLESPDDGSALVYVYRPKAFYQKNAWPNLHVNGVDYGPLKNGGYFKVAADPGMQLIEARQKNILTSWQIGDLSISTECQKNQTCFVRISAEMGEVYLIGSVASVTGTGNITVVPKAEALVELESLNEM